MLKSKFSKTTEKLSLKIGMLFSKLPLHPNHWTILSIIPALIGFYFLAFQKQINYAIIAFAIAGIFDAIDGGVARVVGKTTNFGAYLDGMFDRFVEFLLLFGLMIFGLPNLDISGVSIPTNYILIFLLFFGSGMVSFARAYADHRKALSEEDVKKMPGLFERPERIATILLAMIAFNFAPIWATYLIAIAAALSVYTLFERMIFVYRQR